MAAVVTAAGLTLHESASSGRAEGRMVQRGSSTADRDVWIIAGQSNSQGWGLLKAPIAPDPRITFFVPDKGWVQALEPANEHFSRWTPDPVDQNLLLQRTGVAMPKGLTPQAFVDRIRSERTAPGGVGPALMFAKQLLPHTARNVGVLSFGTGSPISRWDPGEDGKAAAPMYRDLVRRIHASTGTFKGLIWYQGESDALTPGAADRYGDALVRVLTGIRRETRRPDLPVICVQIGRFTYPYDSSARGWEGVREAQRQVSLRLPNVYLVPAHDLMLEDSIHIAYEGYVRLAGRLAEVALTHVYRVKGRGTPLTFQSAELLAVDHRRPLICVRFAGVSGRLSAPGRPMGFEVRARRPAQDPAAGYPGRPTADVPMFTLYRADFDPTDPSAVILGLFDASPIMLGRPHPLCESLQVIYGPGLDPHANIVDARDMPIPAFGPIDVTGPACAAKPDSGVNRR
jgi:hypothetical protein